MAHYGGGPPGGHVPPPDLGHGAPGHHAPPGGGYGGGYSSAPQISGPVVKISSEADTKFNVGVHGDTVIVVHANDSDPSQQWIKDESWGSKAKDSAGQPAFALVNKATGKALAHPKKEEEKVYLTEYRENALDADVLWTSADVGKGYVAIRSVGNIHFNLDIDHGNKKYGGVKEGKAVIVFSWKDEDNQKWKLEKISESHGRY